MALGVKEGLVDQLPTNHPTSYSPSLDGHSVRSPGASCIDSLQEAEYHRPASHVYRTAKMKIIRALVGRWSHYPLEWRVGLCCSLALALLAPAFGQNSSGPSSRPRSSQDLGRNPTLPTDELQEKLQNDGLQSPKGLPKKNPAPSDDSNKGGRFQPECRCEPTDEVYCRLELTGFEPGHFSHPDLPHFAHKVGTLIRLHESSRRPLLLRLVKTTGQTDGLENNGVCCWGHVWQIEDECRGIASAAPNDLLYEEELGKARECLVRKAIEQLLQDPLPIIPQDWQRSTFDIRTGGADGPRHRKVDVEMWIKEACSYGEDG
jgi:hypothetical protein